MGMSNDFNENMVMYAFRYALGRATYAVLDVCEYVIKNKNSLSVSLKERIIKEIKQHYNNLPDEYFLVCNKESWFNLIEELEK